MSDSYTLPTIFQTVIHQSKYARWDEAKGRRETWPETVDRYLSFMREHLYENAHGELLDEEVAELRQGILSLSVMPSMRALMTAGPALKRDHVAGFNCAFVAVDRPQAFDEALYILCCGTGVGFSVERQFVNDLPEIPAELFPSDTTVVVSDSKIGWASALRQVIHLLYSGVIPLWDVSKVRPAGAKLKTFGGRASGPQPLIDLFEYVVATFKNAQGRKLTSIEAHGIMCKIGDIVVVGGVRRSALISLSNPSDDRMRDAKSGQWWDNHPEYALANNSAAWTEKPSMERFIEEWTALIKSKSGERGIFNREAALKKTTENGRRVPNTTFGTNPCGEILLRSREFCNLSEAIIRPDDTMETLFEKVRLATIIGTIQSTLTNFRYVSNAWRKNCEEERLLGVSLTGIMDHPILSGRDTDMGAFLGPWDKAIHWDLESVLEELRRVAVETNEEWAERFGINQSVAVTCVKPSGTVSLLVDSASGIHPRWNNRYIRTMRGNKNDPVSQMLYMQGVPCEDEALHPDTTWVFSYPIEAPKGSVTRNEMTAIEQLELWLVYAEHWCEHNPSITVYVRDEEWLEVGAFVYKHFDRMCGVSFLPHTEHSYKQAPLQDCTDGEFQNLVNEMPKFIDWTRLAEYEKEDRTESVRDLACVSGACDVI